MANIELVIKIPEEIYQHYKKVWQKRRGSIPESCIAFGMPLPKGHGDLIDREELLKQPIDIANYPSNYVRIAHTIIEADKEKIK